MRYYGISLELNRILDLVVLTSHKLRQSISEILFLILCGKYYAQFKARASIYSAVAKADLVITIGSGTGVFIAIILYHF